MQSLTAFLATVPLFSSMTPEERARLAPYFRLRPVAEGEVVLWEGRPHKSLFVLMQGRVVVTKQIRGDAEAVLAHLEPGAHFGEIDLVDGQSASASVTVEKAGALLEFDQNRLLQLLDADNRLFSTFSWALLRDLVTKLRRTNQKLQETILWSLDATATDPSDLG